MEKYSTLESFYPNGKFGWLIWSFVHLISITGFNNKILVAINWIMKYFRYEKANQLIIRKYEPNEKRI